MDCGRRNPFEVSNLPVEDLSRFPQYTWDGPVIYAVDHLEETTYVLRRPGLPTLSAPWPHPLERICPEARRIRTQGSETAT